MSAKFIVHFTSSKSQYDDGISSYFIFDLTKRKKVKEFLSKSATKIANELSRQFPDRFIPRYNMVSFTSIPYSEVYERGNIQKKIISSLDLENPNFDILKNVIENKLSLIN